MKNTQVVEMTSSVINVFQVVYISRNISYLHTFFGVIEILISTQILREKNILTLYIRSSKMWIKTLSLEECDANMNH